MTPPNCFNLDIGTFNVRGLTSLVKQKQLEHDLEAYKLDIVCLQETKVKEGGDWRSNHLHRFLCFETDSRHYGNGFLVNKKWENNIEKVWKVSDRICVIQIGLNCANSEDNTTQKRQGRVKSISIVNVYAPTSAITKRNEEELDKLYKDLQETIDKLKNDTITLIAGDFNAKVGKRSEGETCLGRHSRGYRNQNGEALIDFCEENKLFITNSAFQKPARNITTWVGSRKDQDGNTIPIYNQIDYIICKYSKKHLLTNSQSYGGTIVTSDHKLVKSSFKFDLSKLWKKKTVEPKAKTNITLLATCPGLKEKYQEQLKTQIKQIDVNEKAHKQWEKIKQSIQSVTKESIGTQIISKRQDKSWDPEIEKLSTAQKDLRLRILNCRDTDTISQLKKKRNAILHEIRKITTNARNIELDRLVEDIDKSNSDGGMFKAVKLLNRKPNESPKIEDEEGKLATNPDEILKLTSNFFKQKFRKEDANDIEPFEGEPRRLNKQISQEEVRNSINRLNNGKAPGEDDINSELLKYGPAILDERLSLIFNKVFENHENIDINNGLMITIPKPGKPKGPAKNLRPITLLTTIRKTLSLIVLQRIRPKVEEYLSHSQSGFRPDRSTSDIAWTHKWITAKVNLTKLEVKITGIDMSAAFDTIKRELLLQILEGILDNDELRIIRFLLSNTKINIKIAGASSKLPFISNIGTPQGDSLSPILFIVYLEHALKEVRKIRNTPTDEIEKSLPQEAIYADDIDFIGLEHIDINKVQDILKEYNLMVNVDKTELVNLNRKEDQWKSVKKVGSLLGDKADIERRKRLSQNAMHKLTHIWIRNDKIKLKTKIKLYNTLVKSILLYNSATWALTKTDEERLDAFHRKQLRRMLGIHYPVKITNESLYKKCNETPISTQILEARWKLFGHVLRRNPAIPANKAMQFYFITTNTEKYRGRPITSLPVTLKNDLKKVDNYNLKLTSQQDLEELRNIAYNRQNWRLLTRRMRAKAEAARSVDHASARQ